MTNPIIEIVKEDSIIEISSVGLQGPAGKAGVSVSDTNPNLIEPGLWIQTGLGLNGDGITFWVEDGK